MTPRSWPDQAESQCQLWNLLTIICRFSQCFH
uniref:Pentatricopeptide repeat-containing protein At1g71060 n=1 Tax=Rhizophora mucronata TaxID=61149 RepID=A0A2P2N2E7_RHIMU